MSYVFAILFGVCVGGVAAILIFTDDEPPAES